MALWNRTGHSERPTTMRIRLLLIVVGLAVLAGACAEPGTTVQTTPPTTIADEQLDELAAARSQWESSAPAD